MVRRKNYSGNCQTNNMNQGTSVQYARNSISCPNMNNCNNDEELFDNTCNQCSCMNMELSDCNCGFNDPYNAFPINVRLGQSYVPKEEMPDKVFKPNVGLKKGTIFPDLFNPYVPCQSIEEIAFLKRTNEIKGGCNR